MVLAVTRCRVLTFETNASYLGCESLLCTYDYLRNECCLFWFTLQMNVVCYGCELWLCSLMNAVCYGCELWLCSLMKAVCYRCGLPLGTYFVCYY